MTPSRTRSVEGGFALVGVVMFILVLTILGLSLFSLSGYESQFMLTSLDRSEALYAAQGGLERARFVLARTESLQSVANYLPLDGVDYAVAKQGANTTGPLDWEGEDVLVRVRGVKNGQIKTIEAMFHPAQIKMYDRLMTLFAADTGLFVYQTGHVYPTAERWSQTLLYGEIRQNDGDVTNPQDIKLAEGSNITLQFGGVIPPDLQTYFNTFLSQAELIGPDEKGPSSLRTYDLDGGEKPNRIGFFKSSGGGDYSVNIDNGASENLVIKVDGTAIWLLTNGLRAYHTVRVEGTADGLQDLLVIVAGTPPSRNTGFMLHGSIHAMYGGNDQYSIPVILVSDGRVVLQHHGTDDYRKSSRIDWLTIYAQKALIMGPYEENPPPGQGQPTMVLSHTQTSQVLKNLLDQLGDLGLLPNLQGGVRGRLTQVAGTWREVPEGDSL